MRSADETDGYETDGYGPDEYGPPRSENPQTFPPAWRILHGGPDGPQTLHVASGLIITRKISSPKTVVAVENCAYYGQLPPEWAAKFDDLGNICYVHRDSDGVVTEQSEHPIHSGQRHLIAALDLLDDLHTGNKRAQAVFHPDGGDITTITKSQLPELGEAVGMIIITNIDIELVRALHRSSYACSAFAIRHMLAHLRPSFRTETMIRRLREFDQRNDFKRPPNCRVMHWLARYDRLSRTATFSKKSPQPFHTLADNEAQISVCSPYPHFSLVLVDSWEPSVFDTSIPQKLSDPGVSHAQNALPSYYRHSGEGHLNFCECVKRAHSALYMGLFSLESPVQEKALQSLIIAEVWRDNLNFLQEELEYLTLEAVRKPIIVDFHRLNICRKLALKVETGCKAFVDDLKIYFSNELSRGTNAENIGHPDLVKFIESESAQATKIKQDLNDVFQLLVGANSILDADIQKKLAREGIIQARRSTALTPLAAIYLPLSLATSVFGMNITEIHQNPPKWWAAVALALGLLILSALFMIWIFLEKSDDNDQHELVNRRPPIPTGELDEIQRPAPPEETQSLLRPTPELSFIQQLRFSLNPFGNSENH